MKARQGVGLRTGLKESQFCVGVCVSVCVCVCVCVWVGGWAFGGARGDVGSKSTRVAVGDNLG